MAGRKADPLTKFRVYLHIVNKYRYAAIQTPVTSHDEKITRYKIQHLGSVDEKFKFYPNMCYKLLSSEEQSKLIFPDECDLSMIETNTIRNDKNENSEELGKSQMNKGDTEEKKESPEYDQNNNKETKNRLYGAFWLLEQISKKIGLYDDLVEVFNNNIYKVNKILSLAIFPYISNKNFNRFAQWQKTHKTLIDSIFTSPNITKFSQSLCDNDRMKLIELRLKRQPKGSYQDCDSTTKSAWGKCLADIRWGNNKDNPKLKNTTEVTIYSLSSHEPVYYRLFPGNTSDVTTVRTILSDLNSLKIEGISDILSIVTDRGFISEENIAYFVGFDIPFLMCIKVNNPLVSKILAEIKYDEDGLPLNMEYDQTISLYLKQLEIPAFSSVLSNETTVDVVGLRVNIYLDSVRRVREIIQINDLIVKERGILDRDLKRNFIPNNIKKYNSMFEYFKVIPVKNAENEITSFSYEECTEKIKREKTRCGFFSSVVYKLDKNAKESFDLYKLRDEHEKNFDILKNRMNYNLQRNSSEDGKDGISFIAFVGLIIASSVRFSWSSKLRDEYPSTYAILDEMESIRFCEYKDGSSHMTTFSKKQTEISRCCGIEPPEESLTKSSKKST